MNKQATKTAKKSKRASSASKKSAGSTLDQLLDKAKAASAAEDWGAFEQALADYLADNAECIETLYLQSFLAHFKDNPSFAIELAEKAMTLEGACDEIADTLATYYALIGDLPTSVYYAKIAHTLEPSPRLKALIPPSFPTFTTAYATMTEKPLRQRAREAFEKGDLSDSEHWYRQHLAFDPKDRDAYLGLVTGMLAQGELRGVVDTLRAGRHALPDDPQIAAQLAHTLILLGDFAQGHACHRWAQQAAPDDAAIHAQALVDLMIDPDQQTRDFPALTRAWGERFGSASGDDIASDFFEAEEPAPKDQLTVGFILGSAGSTARGVTLSSLLMRLDENRFQTVGFGLGALSDTGNVVFQKCIGRWHDIGGVDPVTLKAIVAAEEIDILIHVAGFSAPEALTLSGRRLAPCQVAWTGTPYGTGVAEIDYMLTDSYLDPKSGTQPAYTEEPAYLDLGSVVAFPLVSKQEPLGARAGEELLFAADAKLHELTPDTISLWARILHKAPQSKLILLDYDFKQRETLDRLVALFGTFGVSQRIDIVDSSVSSKFFEQADVCLLPTPMPSPQVAVDALWGGCPAICLSQEGRHTREAGSVLTHLGFGDDMIAETRGDYVALALKWADDPDGRQAFRSGVREKVLDSSSFDTKARADDLCKALDTLWQKTCEKH